MFRKVEDEIHIYNKEEIKCALRAKKSIVKASVIK